MVNELYAAALMVCVHAGSPAEVCSQRRRAFGKLPK